MNNDELDRILSKRDDIQPSSGFAASVMEAVREEAAAPPPIPFPWKRALPVLVFAALALVVVVAAGAVSIVQFSRGEVTSQIASSSSSYGIGCPHLRAARPAPAWVGWQRRCSPLSCP